MGTYRLYIDYIYIETIYIIYHLQTNAFIIEFMGIISHSDYLVSKKWILTWQKHHGKRTKVGDPNTAALRFFACPSRRMTVGKFMKLQNKKPSPPAMKIVKQILYVNDWCISITFNSKKKLAFCASGFSPVFFWKPLMITQLFIPMAWQWVLGSRDLAPEEPQVHRSNGEFQQLDTKNLFLILICFSWILSATKLCSVGCSKSRVPNRKSKLDSKFQVLSKWIPGTNRGIFKPWLWKANLGCCTSLQIDQEWWSGPSNVMIPMGVIFWIFMCFTYWNSLKPHLLGRAQTSHSPQQPPSDATFHHSRWLQQIGIVRSSIASIRLRIGEAEPHSESGKVTTWIQNWN